jgi:hypothetical protein
MQHGEVVKAPRCPFADKLAHHQTEVEATDVNQQPFEFTPDSALIGTKRGWWGNAGSIGPTQDDVSLLWLAPGAHVTDAVGALEASGDAESARPDLLRPVPDDNVQLTWTAASVR